MRMKNWLDVSYPLVTQLQLRREGATAVVVVVVVVVVIFNVVRVLKPL